jgi:predicted transcriptional regulator
MSGGTKSPRQNSPTLISTVHEALGRLGESLAEPVTARTPAVPVRRSVTPNFVVCLDCAWKGKMLRRHLTTAHGLSVEQYRARWNLPPDHAITAPGYSERRSTMAKQLGLGQRGKARAAPPAPTESSPRRCGRPRATPASTETA